MLSEMLKMRDELKMRFLIVDCGELEVIFGKWLMTCVIVGSVWSHDKSGTQSCIIIVWTPSNKIPAHMRNVCVCVCVRSNAFSQWLNRILTHSQISNQLALSSIPMIVISYIWTVFHKSQPKSKRFWKNSTTWIRFYLRLVAFRNCAHTTGCVNCGSLFASVIFSRKAWMTFHKLFTMKMVTLNSVTYITQLIKMVYWCQCPTEGTQHSILFKRYHTRKHK